jgi:WD repeat and FYVE domain-containing protein 3
VGQIIHPDKIVLAVEQNKVLMPPTFSRYIAWGFADHSLRIGMYDSDRAMFVCETTAHSGEILACASPNARTIITAGTSSVVTVWELSSRQKSLNVKHSLHGHTDAVTCLAASPAYNIIVSGSRDGTAIVWDMSRFIFVRQLRDVQRDLAAPLVDQRRLLGHRQHQHRISRQNAADLVRGVLDDEGVGFAECDHHWVD